MTQFGLSEAVGKNIHEIAAEAKGTGSSATLSNHQAACIVVSGELHCLEKLAEYISSRSPQSLVEHSLSAWQRRKRGRQRNTGKLQT